MIDIEITGSQQQIVLLHLARPHKRNALSDGLIEALERAFDALPEQARAVVVAGRGEHFSAGLDLSELRERDAPEGMVHSRSWHRAFDKIQFGRVPVIAALHGAVVGGGLELAVSCHLRVADDSVFYALPEGSRGLFVGGGGAARIPRVVGVPCMTDMMLTGRVLSADEGHAAGITQYRVARGEALARALELAERVSKNAPLSNYAVMHVLPRIAEQSQEQGLLMESLMAAIAQSAPEAKARLRAFLDNKADKVKAPGR